ncbi:MULTISPECIES: undecaprenyl-diphosphate phosphatase [unclassified Halomonas]|uniref:undecaprenyl-diphosphate phosphatase n=1 Tax=unclassified Halomonas TaxID=2609666 RepID=UPI0006DA745F|nr:MULTISPECIES: undecaprenyl-diphosphate phosphatase [unclassified Halomonas]KPQ27206.1 MAG: undecaprenyl-diphosphatase UppP [Halomonas sp. HL-93]SBR52596.1 Undecaprenyl-diphosphatase [Halomonas sp. HL-93]SNY97939.1 Undecaprenyl-diphosphatase [Halomonas sp. hl-4]
MDWLQIVVLALVQGVSEFLPVSSSAHLILVPVLTEWEDQGLAFDVALHLGSLSAVVVYFRHELWQMVSSCLAALKGQRIDRDARLAVWVILATLPVCAVGFLMRDVVAEHMRSTLIIGLSLVFFGLWLGYADWQKRGSRSEYQLTFRDALLIGAAQVLALIPGTSRSGITMTAALMLGMSREGAARFSFLLSIPVIVLAGGLEAIELIGQPNPVDGSAMLAGTLLSGLSAYACIHFFLALIKRLGMQPFVLYRVLFGIWLLWFFHG